MWTDPAPQELGLTVSTAHHPAFLCEQACKDKDTSLGHLKAWGPSSAWDCFSSVLRLVPMAVAPPPLGAVAGAVFGLGFPGSTVRGAIGCHLTTCIFLAARLLIAASLLAAIRASIAGLRICP